MTYMDVVPVNPGAEWPHNPPCKYLLYIVVVDSTVRRTP